MLFMLVESRGPFDEGSRSSREPWLVALLGWLLPWPALIVWLCVASRVLDGWIAVACVFVAIGLAAWRGLRALPAEGLNQAKQ
jgi:bacteriorhodopsin